MSAERHRKLTDEPVDISSAILVVDEVESSNYDRDVCCRSLKVLVNLSANILTRKNPEFFARVLDAGVCELVVSVLEKHGIECAEIAAYGCTIVMNLSEGSKDLAEHFAENGACEMIVYVASLHIGEPDIVDAAAGAIGMLANNNISNSFLLAKAGACDVLSQLGNFGFNVRHPLCAQIAARVCFAYSNLAEASNSVRILEAGGCDLIVSLMRFHKDNTAVIIAGIKAICCLSSLNYEHREALNRAGACQILVDAVNSNISDLNCLQDICEAIMHMALLPANADKLGDCGVCNVIVNKLCPVLKDQPFGAEICTGAMLNLITYGSKVISNKEHFLSAGIVEQCLKMQLSSRASCRARDNIQEIFQCLGVDPSELLTSVPVSPTRSFTGGRSNSMGSSADLHALNTRSNSNLVGVIAGCEAKEGVVPLTVEVRHFHEVKRPDGVIDGSPLLVQVPSDNNIVLSAGIYEI